MDSEDFSEEYLRGFNDGYSEAEEDLIANNFSTDLHKEELDLNYAKGRKEGMRFCIGALGDLLNNYSCIETDDPVKLESIKNQILAIKYAMDYIQSLKEETEFNNQPWL